MCVYVVTTTRKIYVDDSVAGAICALIPRNPRAQMTLKMSARNASPVQMQRAYSFKTAGGVELFYTKTHTYMYMK